MNTNLVVPVILMLFTVSAAAESTPWYLWKNGLDEQTHCAQTSPGQQWIRTDGSYSTRRCSTTTSASPDRKGRMLGLMSLFASVRSSR